jgi:hypothetical protein
MVIYLDSFFSFCIGFSTRLGSYKVGSSTAWVCTMLFLLFCYIMVPRCLILDGDDIVRVYDRTVRFWSILYVACLVDRDCLSNLVRLRWAVVDAVRNAAWTVWHIMSTNWAANSSSVVLSGGLV